MRHLRMDLQDDVKHLVSILLALIPMLVIFFIVPSVNEYFEMTRMGVTAKMVIISVIFISFTVIPCYFICRRHPGSALYAPAVATLSSIWIISGRLPEYWTKNGKLWLLGTALIMAMIAGIVGSLRGDKVKEEE